MENRFSSEKHQEMQEDEKIQHLAGYLINDFIDGKESFENLLKKCIFEETGKGVNYDLAQKILVQVVSKLKAKELVKKQFNTDLVESNYIFSNMDNFIKTITEWEERLKDLKQKANQENLN